jgi:type II secretory pathway component PulM
MKAALWTKLKVMGPVRGLDTEMQRFRLWLPAPLHPALRIFQQWRIRYHQARHVDERIRIEQQAIEALIRCRVDIREQALLAEFLQRLESARNASLKARRAALGGESIDSTLDDQLINELLCWLGEYRHDQQREIALWLSRMMQAWQMDRKL